jgi:hypothetical protein
VGRRDTEGAKVRGQGPLGRGGRRCPDDDTVVEDNKDKNRMADLAFVGPSLLSPLMGT